MSAPATCTLSGHVYDLAGAGKENALVRVRISPASDAQLGDGYVDAGPTTAYSAATTGAWSLVVPQGVTVRVEIPLAGIDHVGSVPDAATADLEDVALEPWRGYWP